MNVKFCHHLFSPTVKIMDYYKVHWMRRKRLACAVKRKNRGNASFPGESNFAVSIIKACDPGA